MSTATGALAVLNPEKLAADDLAFLASVTYDVRALNDGTTHEPFGDPGGPGLWHHKGKQLPAYIQQIAQALVRAGHPESAAIATAVSRCKVWCAGGQHVTAETKAKACAAVSEWEADKAETKASADPIAKLFDPSLHPRAPKGSPAGGQFAPGGGGSTPTNQNPVGNGEQGKRVADLQKRLNALGYKVKADGKFGPQMDKAVRAFQAAHGLKIDGLVGPKTTAALRSKSAKRKTTVRKVPVVQPFQKTTVTRKNGVTSAAIPELVTLPGVDLLAAGSWELSSGRNTFTREDITNAIEAAKCPAVGAPVIKLGHVDPRFNSSGDNEGVPLTQNFDGQPAIGRVINLRTDDSGNRLVGDLADMPGWLGSIAHAAYPKRSVEGSYGFKCQIGHTHPFVLTGLALLGVTSPGVGVLNALPDIASLYGVEAAIAERPWRTAPQDLEGEVVAVTEEDVRRAYYAHGGAPSTWWITELQMSPTQLVVAGDSNQIYRVPFQIEGDGGTISFGEPEPVESYGDLAASRGTGRSVTYASAEDSRAVASLEYSEGGWVQRDGLWVYDPDEDGDNDATPGGDTDNSHWDTDGNLKPGVKIPPKPTSASADDGDPEHVIDAAADDTYSGPYADTKNKKYKLGTEAQARAAWSYINMPKNADLYPMNGVTLAEVKSAIQAACKKFGIETKAAAADPPTLNGDDKTGNYDNASMTHGSFTGKHSHPHAANGSQGSDDAHTHSHTHSGDGDHGHTHAAASDGKGGSNVEFTNEQEANLRNVLGLGDDDELTPEVMVTASAALKDKADAKVRAGAGKLPPGVITIEEEVWKSLNNKVEAGEKFRAKVGRDERDEVIGGAIKAGKFSAARADHWRRLWDADPEGTRNVLATLKNNTVPVNDIGAAGGNLDDLEYDDEFAALFAPGQYTKGQ